MKRFLSYDRGLAETAVWEPRCWVNVECPDAADLAFLENELGVPRDFLDDTSDMDERPRLDSDGEWRMAIIRIPVPGTGDISPYSTIPLSIIASGDITITLCYRKTDFIEDFIDHSCRRNVKFPNVSAFILRLIYSSTFWYLRYLKEMTDEVTLSERSLRRNISNAELRRLLCLQNALVFFNTSLQGNDSIIVKIRHVFPDNFDNDLLEDVEIEIRQALGTIAIYTDILEATMDTYSSLISNNTNDVMKRMTAITIVLMIPTLIASFYGMNVPLGVENSRYAFPIIILVAIALSAACVFLLKRIRWL